MMDARLGWLLLGCAVGFVIGYIVRSLQEIKEKVDEVDKVVKRKRTMNDDGLVRYPLLFDAALLLVVAFTVWASFASQKASNDVRSTQASQERTATCTEQFLTKTITALNARTQYNIEQSTANIQLQKSQLEFLSNFFKKPPPTETDNRAAFRSYITSLSAFISVSSKNTVAIASNPFPTKTEFQDCIHKK